MEYLPIFSVHTIEAPIAIIDFQLSDYGNQSTCQFDTWGQKTNEHIRFHAAEKNVLPAFEQNHRHDYFELMFVIDGEIDIMIETGIYHYKRGDACLINRNTRHHECFNSNFHIRYLCISRDFFLQAKCSLKDFQASKKIIRFFQRNLDDETKKNKDYIDFSMQIADGLPSVAVYTDQMIQEMEQKEPGYEYFTIGLLNRFFAQFDNEKLYRTTYINLGLKSAQCMVDDVINLIHARKRRVTRKELSEELNYNGDYINRIFKKQTGLTIQDYCLNICLKEAADLLLNTELHIQEITHQLGFENRTHFNKMFKSYYGVSPKEYRS